MTGKPTSGNPLKKAAASKLGIAKSDDVATENAPPNVTERDAAKASVHEAIGKLIGDDAERRRGTADKEAAGITPGKSRKSPRS